jgi:chromosomal replication initiation ATPase DnaA
MSSLRAREREAERIAAAIALRNRLLAIRAVRTVAEPRVIYDAPIGPVDYPIELGPTGEITVRYIVARVCARYGVIPEAFMGRKRHATLFHARQEMVWLAMTLSGLSFERTAQALRRSRKTITFGAIQFAKRHGLPTDCTSAEARRIARRLLERPSVEIAL